MPLNWTDTEFYPEDEGNSPNPYTVNSTTGPPYSPRETRVYVKNSFFSHLNNRAINYIATTSSKMLIETSTFNACTSFSDGGSIYQSEGNFILSKCCGFKCYSTGTNVGGMFAYTTLSAGSKNTVLDTSISFSYDVEDNIPGYHASLDLRQGSIYVNTLNTSYNNIKQNAGIYFCIRSSDEISYISFASIRENNSTLSNVNTKFQNFMNFDFWKFCLRNLGEIA